jgi:hypothetical protein
LGLLIMCAGIFLFHAQYYTKIAANMIQEYYLFIHRGYNKKGHIF